MISKCDAYLHIIKEQPASIYTLNCTFLMGALPFPPPSVSIKIHSKILACKADLLYV